MSGSSDLRTHPEATPFDVTTLRDVFPITQEYAYLNNAGIGPPSTFAMERARRVLHLQSTLGSLGSPQWQGWLASARRRASALIGAGEDEVCFLKNTPEGISTVASGLDWRAGDNVVVPNCEFPANVYPWMNLASRGVEVRWVPAPDGSVTLDVLARAVDAHTRVVALSWVQFLSGARVDPTAVGDLCHDRGAYLLLDAIQGLGVYPLNVRRSGVHFVATASHKWLLAPMGAGWLYCQRELIDRLHLTEVGQNTVEPRDSYLDYQYIPKADARRFEPGVPAYASIAGLDAALELLERIGLEAVHAHIERLCTHLIEGLLNQGCEVLTPLDPSARAGIVTFRHPRRPAAELQETLLGRRIVVVNREGAIRVAPHCYNTVEEIDQLLGTLA